MIAYAALPTAKAHADQLGTPDSHGQTAEQAVSGGYRQGRSAGRSTSEATATRINPRVTYVHARFACNNCHQAQVERA